MFSSSDLGWDYQDATQNPVRYPVLQPVLYSASKSCHWDDGYWTQEGSHSYEFSIFSGKKGLSTNASKTVSRNTPLFPVIIRSKTGGYLSDTNSFIRTNAGNVTISTIKKTEDGDDVIVRLFEEYGKAETVKLNFLKNMTNFTRSCITTLIEDETEQELSCTKDSVTIPVAPHSIETLKIESI